MRPLSDPDRPRWSDLSSTLFWLYHRGWPALDVDGETIEGETAWRTWVSRADVTELLAVRDRVGGEHPARRRADAAPGPRLSAPEAGSGTVAQDTESCAPFAALAPQGESR